MAHVAARPGGAYLLRADRMGRAERVLLEAVARAVLRGDRGDLRTQLDRPGPMPAARRRSLVPAAPPPSDTPAAGWSPAGAGAGERARRASPTADGTYAIVLDGAEETPLPWANVIANPQFGTIVTASGSAHTWSGNSRENRLTPFANDPVIDPTAEALFIRDDESGECVVADARAACRAPGERPSASSATRPA